MWYNYALLTQALIAAVFAAPIEDCPGYEASNVKLSASGLTADLKLAGDACNTFGTDLEDLVLSVEYQTDARLHVKIYDKDEEVYQVPKSVVDGPEGGNSSESSSALRFSYEEKPFSFAVSRSDTNETIFNTSSASLVFQSQYVRFRTSLPVDPYIYGFGEDSDKPRRGTDKYRRTLWSRDAGGVVPGTNLYGNHPVYYEHRPDSGKTHGVFFLNSNGMDMYINKTADGGQVMEWNTLGGIVDLYFMAGPDPHDVVQQYAEIVGKPAMQSYWHFGFHQCKYGYQDIMWVAGVVLNYTRAGIPLETMWSDIDYMDRRRTFTLDPDRYPLKMVRELVDYLHDHDQHYVQMVDPAIARTDYPPYYRAKELNVTLSRVNGSEYKGVVWPGVTVFPDWFNDATEDYWVNEFAEFFDADTGVDIDMLWIDMNEAANFCPYPCADPEGYAIERDAPPDPPAVRTTWPALPGFPDDFQPPASGKFKRYVRSPSSPPSALRGVKSIKKRDTPQAEHKGLPDRNLITPAYHLHNQMGDLSQKTLDTDIIHANGLAEYDTHNLYGTMMSSTSRQAMLARRPTRRPLIITRSTFAGAGKDVGHWLGDNNAKWDALQQSIYQIQAFAGMYQMPLVGADVCGFIGTTTEELCGRWAAAGAFYPFYRNHAYIGELNHEFYRWDSVARAAKVAIKARYQLLDYIYTRLHEAATEGLPLINPIWFLYPKEKAALDVGLQYFYGDQILVAPVVTQGATSVSAYFPDDLFYDFFTHEPLVGEGKEVTIGNVTIDKIPVYIRGGSIIPLRQDVANTTTALRKLDFDIVVAPGTDGKASGRLYMDDGDSIEQDAISEITFSYDGTTLKVGGSFQYKTDSKVNKIVLLSKDGADGVKEIENDYGFTGPWTLDLSK